MISPVISARHRKYTLDERAFDVVTDEAAYWIGFLLGDGHIGDTTPQNSRRITLKLASKDAGHVKAFRQFLHSDAPIKAGRVGNNGFAQLTCWSEPLAEALARHAVVPRKSFIARLHLLESSPHAWRGFVDADGWVTLAQRGGRLVPCVGVSGAEPVTTQFAAFVRTVAPACKARPLPHRSIFHLELSCDIAIAVLKAIYLPTATIALPRKLDSANRAIAFWDAYRALNPRPQWATTRWG